MAYPQDTCGETPRNGLAQLAFLRDAHSRQIWITGQIPPKATKSDDVLEQLLLVAHQTHGQSVA